VYLFFAAKLKFAFYGSPSTTAGVPSLTANTGGKTKALWDVAGRTLVAVTVHIILFFYSFFKRVEETKAH
jgi:hypothetical protein